MRRLLPGLLVAWILVLAMRVPACDAYSARGQAMLSPDQGCTVVYATDGDLMLAGNNEDYFNPRTRMWFIPAEEGSFGRVYFGFDDYHAQGGMNDQGLFFDGLGLDETVRVPKEGKAPYDGNLVDKIMSECATVECVAQTFETYYNQDAWFWQHMFGDATGESAIVEAATIIRQRGGTQVATNFLQSRTPEGERTCPRYQTATEMLAGMDVLSVEFVRDVMDAVHANGPAHTLYTNVYDLVQGLVYLYYFHDYEQVVVIDLEEELAKGYHTVDLPALFPPNPAADRWAGPKLEQYERLVESRRAHQIGPEVLQAYAGEYAMPAGWGAPDEHFTVIAQEGSLLLRFPDYRLHELFPASATEFYHVSFQESSYVKAYDVRFGLDEARRVQYLALIFGSDTAYADRLGPESFVPEVATPEPTATLQPTDAATRTAVPAPTDTAAPTDTPAPTATPEPTAMPEPTATQAPTATPTPTLTPILISGLTAQPTLEVQVATPVPLTAVPSDAQPAPGFPWLRLVTIVVVVALVVGVVAGWIAFLKRR